MNDVKSTSFEFRTTEETKSFLDKLAKKISYIINDLLEYFTKNPPKSIPVEKRSNFVLKK